MNVDHRCDMDIFTTHYGGISRLIIGYIMLQKFLISVVVFAFSRGVFAAGLVVPQGGIALGEVQPGEAIEKTVVISNDAERAIAVSFAKNAVSKELGENRFKQLIKKVGEEKAMAMLEKSEQGFKENYALLKKLSEM